MCSRWCLVVSFFFFFFQAEDGIRDFCLSRGLGDVYKRQIHIRTHNTNLKKRLAAYAEQYPDECCKTDTDPETGCMEFDIAKGRFSFRLTAPYSEERREAARRYARENNAADRLK